MPDGLDREVDVEFRPIEMTLGWQLDVENLPDRDVPEPWKLGELQENLFLVEKNPEAVRRNVGDLNRGNVCAKRC